MGGRGETRKKQAGWRASKQTGKRTIQPICRRRARNHRYFAACPPRPAPEARGRNSCRRSSASFSSRLGGSFSLYLFPYFYFNIFPGGGGGWWAAPAPPRAKRAPSTGHRKAFASSIKRTTQTSRGPESGSRPGPGPEPWPGTTRPPNQPAGGLTNWQGGDAGPGQGGAKRN